MVNGDILDYKYDINFNKPIISHIISMNPIHILDSSEWTEYEIKVAIQAPAGIEDIESVDFYVRKVAFVDSGTLFNGDCTYDDPIIDSDYWETFEGWNMDYSHSTSSFHVYKTTVPIRPISQCGGYGLVEWKFKVYNKKGFQNNINSDAVEFCNGYNNCQYSSIGE